MSNPRKIEKRRSLGSVWRRAMHWLANMRYGVRNIEVAVPPLQTRFTVVSDTIFAWKLVKYAAYEPENTNWVTENFSYGGGGFFVDVGANFGWYSVLFGKCAGDSGRVVSFEPDDRNRALLRHNLDVNGIRSVHVVEAGVGEKPGSAELFMAPSSNPGMHSMVSMPHTGVGVTVPVVTLDEALKPFDGVIDLLKIDIEGFEVDALLGARETLARCRRVLVEYSPAFLRKAGREPAQLISLLLGAGFALHTPGAEARAPLEPAWFESLEKGMDDWNFFQVDLLAVKQIA